MLRLWHMCVISPVHRVVIVRVVELCDKSVWPSPTTKSPYFSVSTTTGPSCCLNTKAMTERWPFPSQEKLWKSFVESWPSQTMSLLHADVKFGKADNNCSGFFVHVLWYSLSLSLSLSLSGEHLSICLCSHHRMFSQVEHSQLSGRAVKSSEQIELALLASGNVHLETSLPNAGLMLCAPDRDWK